MPDLQAACGWCRGVVTQDHILADERCVDFVDDSVQAHRAVALDAAFGFEQEQRVEVERRIGQTHVLATQGPLVEWRALREAAVRGVMVFAFDPGPEPAVESVEALEVSRLKRRQQLHA